MPEYSPLSSCFYSGRTLHASDEDDEVQQEWTARRCQPSCVFFLAEEGAEPEPVAAAEDLYGTVVGPFVG